jgi:ATP-dependent Clp protease ATP-binding subunit ClpA
MMGRERRVVKGYAMASPDPCPYDIFEPGGQVHRRCMTAATAKVLCEAIRLARETRWDSVRSPHIFMGLLADPDPGVRTWGDRLGADLAKLLSQFQELFHQEDGESGSPLVLHREFLSDNVIRLLRDAHVRAKQHCRAEITPMDLLITLLTASNSIVAECFERIGVTAAKLTELAVLAEQQASRK